MIPKYKKKKTNNTKENKTYDDDWFCLDEIEDMEENDF